MTLGLVILTSAALLAKYPNPKWYVQTETIEASTSEYTSTESPGINARGYSPIAGKSIACPKRIKLGSRIIIRNVEYTCDDRYADWVQNRFGDTFDIFGDSYEGAVRYGRQKKTVTIIYP